MADFKTTVALEIGAQSVSMAVFTPVGKGFALSRYARRDVLLDPVEEGMRIDYVSNAIGEMVEELKVRGSEVRNVVSGQQVFMRFIKLPALDMNDISEQVGYEAQQHIPFPIDDIVYSYQELGESPDGEREVLLVAIKKDLLDSLNSQVEGNGLRTPHQLSGRDRVRRHSGHRRQDHRHHLLGERALLHPLRHRGRLLRHQLHLPRVRHELPRG